MGGDVFELGIVPYQYHVLRDHAERSNSSPSQEVKFALGKARDRREVRHEWHCGRTCCATRNTRKAILIRMVIDNGSDHCTLAPNFFSAYKVRLRRSTQDAFDEQGGLWCFDLGARVWSLPQPRDLAANYTEAESYHCALLIATPSSPIHAGCLTQGRLKDL